MKDPLANSSVREAQKTGTAGVHWATLMIGRTHRAGDIEKHGEWLCMCPSCRLCRLALLAESQAEAAGGAR